MPTVSDILGRKGREVVSIAADDSVLDAAQLMNRRGIGGLVVLEQGKLAGIFTERDVLRRVVAERRDPVRTPIRSVMSSPVYTCAPDQTLDDCIALITERRVRHVPVVDDSGLCGIITSGDILAQQMREQQDTIHYLSSYVFDIRT
jgi:CBS domain-containing protein